MIGCRALTAVALCIILAPSASAQTPADSARLAKPLFKATDLYIVGMFTATTIALFPADKHLASVFRDEDLVTNRDLKRAATAFRFFGGPGPYVIGGSMYVVGRVAHVQRAAELALHGTEAVVVGQGVSGVLKVILGRARPYTSADTNPRNFGFGRGLKNIDYQSFPSGHATSAFAAAAAVSTETAAWWPRTRWIFAPILYGGAALVGLSRIYDDKHWASDVVMGAAVGTFAGLKTVRFNHTHEGNRLDRWLLGKSPVSSGLRLFGDGRSLGLATDFRW
jgi:membrane-associated phospholipid phosphatase